VLDAPDGEHAIAILDELGSELDLVLSDAVVPGIGTTELEARVRQRRPDIPILFMSGYSREEMAERGLIHPQRPFLQKPFTTDQLNELVCQELEAGRRPVVSR
jgi:two-component system, cell cycle sensor histidine kinase and response regulator CckA